MPAKTVKPISIMNNQFTEEFLGFLTTDKGTFKWYDKTVNKNHFLVITDMMDCLVLEEKVPIEYINWIKLYEIRGLRKE